MRIWRLSGWRIYIRTRTMNRIKSVFMYTFHSNHSLLPDDQHLWTLHKVDSPKSLAKPWALMVWSVLVWGKFPWAGEKGKGDNSAAGSPGVWKKKVMDPIALDRWLKRNLNDTTTILMILMIGRFSWKTSPNCILTFTYVSYFQHLLCYWHCLPPQSSSIEQWTNELFICRIYPNIGDHTTQLYGD